MYSTVSVFLFVGVLSISGYAKPLHSSEEVTDDIADEKLNTCAADVIRLIAQQEKTHQVDFSSLSEGCLELVNGAMQYVKDLDGSSSSSEQTEKNKREDIEGSGTASQDENYSSVLESQPETGDWKETIDNVLYHLLKAIEFEHEKLQKTLKWIAELQENQNQIAEGIVPPRSEGNRNDERKRSGMDDVESPAERMKDFYNDLTPGDLRGLMENKPPAFVPAWEDNQLNKDSESKILNEIEDIKSEDSASEMPAEEKGDDESEIEMSDDVDKLEERELEIDSANEAPAEKAEGDEEEKDSASEPPAEEKEEGGVGEDESASQVPAEETNENQEAKESASETPADEREEGGVGEDESASEKPAEETEEDGVGEDESASEVPAEETEEGRVGEDESASEVPAEETEEGGVGEDESASEVPAQETEENGVGENESASEVPAQETEEDGVGEDESASEKPAQETEEGVVGEDESASEVPAQETEEDGVGEDESASEVPAQETKEDGVGEDDSASEVPAEETEENQEAEDSASETPAEETEEENDSVVEIQAEETEYTGNKEDEDSVSEAPAEGDEDDSVEESASETPAEEGFTSEETNQNPASETSKEEEDENYINGYKTKGDEIDNDLTNNEIQTLLGHKYFKKLDENMIPNETVKREPEVVENSLELDSSETLDNTDREEGNLFGSNKEIKDTIVNELKNLKTDNRDSVTMSAVVKALKVLSRKTQNTN